MAGQEQVQRASRKAEVIEVTEKIKATIDGQSAEVVEDAECCLSDIDAALAEAEECCATAVEVLTPKSWREMTDQEILDAGDPQWGEGDYADVTAENYSDMSYEYRNHRRRYDQAYQSIVGVSNQRDCGCGCG